MNLKPVDWYAALTYLSTGSVAVVVTALSGAFPNQAVKFVACGAIVVFISGLLARLFANKTDAPSTAITTNAKVVEPGTTVVTDATPSLGINTTHNV
jgi:hypothetical protein